MSWIAGRVLLARLALLMLVGAAAWAVRSGCAGRALGGWMASPEAAVLLLVTGILLLYAEFNLPGTVVPGAAGALLVMLAVFEMSRMPLRLDGAGLCVAGVGLILLGLVWPRAWGLAGTAVLVLGLARLVEGGVGFRAAFGAGLSFGAATLTLGRIALRARNNKRLRTRRWLHEAW